MNGERHPVSERLFERSLGLLSTMAGAPHDSPRDACATLLHALADAGELAALKRSLGTLRHHLSSKGAVNQSFAVGLLHDALLLTRTLPGSPSELYKVFSRTLREVRYTDPSSNELRRMKRRLIDAGLCVSVPE